MHEDVCNNLLIKSWITVDMQPGFGIMKNMTRSSTKTYFQAYSYQFVASFRLMCTSIEGSQIFLVRERLVLFSKSVDCHIPLSLLTTDFHGKLSAIIAHIQDNIFGN